MIKVTMQYITGLIALLAFVMAAIYYDTFYNNPSLLADYLGFMSPQILQWLTYATLFGVFGISLGVALMHVVGGSLFGATAGGVLNGMKHGFILGLIEGFSRLWPFALVVGLASFIFGGPLWHTITFAVLGGVFFLVEYLADMVWKKINHDQAK